MRITDIQFKIADFQFNEPFKISFATLEGYQTLVIKVITDEDIIGYGEAGPLEFVTGDNLETSLSIGQLFKNALIGQNPIEISYIHEIMDSIIAHNTSIKAAIDIACYDIAAKKMGVPLYQYLGGHKRDVYSDVTIGIDTPEKMALKCKEWVDKGFTILKIKLGETADLDLKRIQCIRQTIGEDVVLRIDANQGWNVKETIRLAREFEKYHVELIEQPVKADDFDGLKEIKDMSRIDIVADESCHLPSDAAKLAGGRKVDGVNIKLMKCGGIYNALKINDICEANHLYCMIGCMGESFIANAAAMHFAVAQKNVTKIDLDVTFFTKSEWIFGGFTHQGSLCSLLDQPGIGLDVWMD
ncbi:MAG: mandelate racemase/muconate lactonizing enzyme family protein [Faecalibacillus sp.]